MESRPRRGRRRRPGQDQPPAQNQGLSATPEQMPPGPLEDVSQFRAQDEAVPSPQPRLPEDQDAAPSAPPQAEEAPSSLTVDQSAPAVSQQTPPAAPAQTSAPPIQAAPQPPSQPSPAPRPESHTPAHPRQEHPRGQREHGSQGREGRGEQGRGERGEQGRGDRGEQGRGDASRGTDQGRGDQGRRPQEGAVAGLSIPIRVDSEIRRIEEMLRGLRKGLEEECMIGSEDTSERVLLDLAMNAIRDRITIHRIQPVTRDLEETDRLLHLRQQSDRHVVEMLTALKSA